MTSTVTPIPTINTTQPWKFLGSVSSVSPSYSNSINFTSSTKAEQPYNGTGYYIEEDGDIMWADLKTVFIACAATLVPLILILAILFGIKRLWIRYKTRKKYIIANIKETTSTEAGDSANKPLHTHLFPDKAVEELHLEIVTETVEICQEVNNRNVNGSIITMTLKNNHLIVETEERNDIQEDSRETTMRYSPSARDGVFVVEVQQGIRRSPTSHIAKPESSNDECALVHNPPQNVMEQDAESHPLEIYAQTGRTSSATSIDSLLHSYTYSSNRYSYDQGSYGYNQYSGYDNDSSIERLVEDHKPKITSALYKTSKLKSMSLDIASTRMMERAPLSQSTSLDNVVESNGEEFDQ